MKLKKKTKKPKKNRYVTKKPSNKKRKNPAHCLIPITKSTKQIDKQIAAFALGVSVSNMLMDFMDSPMVEVKKEEEL